MIRLKDGMCLYHGSYTKVEEIDLSHSHSNLDFGCGFYLTSSLEQAKAFAPLAVQKAKRRKWVPQDFANENGVISVFLFHINPNLFIHYFDEADEEWLHYVACNRRDDLFVELRKKYESVDIIGGKIADDKTAVTLNNYVLGAFGIPGDINTDRRAIDILEPENLQDQFCFKTSESIGSLTFVRSL